MIYTILRAKNKYNNHYHKEIQYKIDDNDCWICISHALVNGYPRLCVNGRDDRVHRYIYARFKGLIPKGICILHSCDNRQCINPDHLWLGTKGDNIRDAMRKGRMPRGERHRWAKLTTGQVLLIKKLIQEGIFHRVIAQQFGVDRATISMIHIGRNWAWLTK